ncbi:MAG: EthD family reductase [Parcubacteria group bacterium]
MVVFSVLYPANPGARFDFDYYTATHIPLVQEVFGPGGLRSVDVHQGLSAGDGGAAPFVCIAHLNFDSPEAMQAAFTAARAGEVMADIANFTDITPVSLVSAKS